MSIRIYVGNLPYTAAENELQDLFAQYGPVTNVELLMDKFTGRPRGFGFVTMETNEGAQAAIQALNGSDLGGRAITVNEARPREERAPRSGGGGGYRGGGRDRGDRDRGGRGDRGSRREYSR